MEILSYVLEGALEHQDSSGGVGVIRLGEIQLMRAGDGVTHSEYNHSKVEPVHFLQIWIAPDARGLKPAYAQQAFDRDAAHRAFLLLTSKDGRDGSLPIHQDVQLWGASLTAGSIGSSAWAPRAMARAGIDQADELGDQDTADIFTEISRGIDKWLWFVEAHLQADR